MLDELAQVVGVGGDDGGDLAGGDLPRKAGTIAWMMLEVQAARVARATGTAARRSSQRKSAPAPKDGGWGSAASGDMDADDRTVRDDREDGSGMIDRGYRS